MAFNPRHTGSARNQSNETTAPSARIAELPAAETLTPDERYQELFVAVQMQQIFADGKIFADASPKREPEDILAEYRSHRQRAGFDLARFVHANFTPEHPDRRDYAAPRGRPLKEHIDVLWDRLTHIPAAAPARSSLLPLPHPYVTPGGRFCEFYYWDTAFTMLGLASCQRRDLMRGMADNFAYLVQTYGHVPNGNRTYYLSRAQPPLFAHVVDLLDRQAIRSAAHYLPMLRKEYDYWMKGAEHIRAGEQCARVVRLADGTLLNRYWDDRDTPRQTSWREDVLTARAAGERRSTEVFRNLRAVGASGWDFSSRWLDDPQDLATVRITSILPIDLNCFLHKLEAMIAELSKRAGDTVSARYFHQAAAARAQAIDHLFWNDQAKAYLDYDWQKRQSRRRLTAATVTPLFCGLATTAQAQHVARALRQSLLAPGGLATTTVANGQQWDRPNGWAPLQWLAIEGLRRYGEQALADTIAQRWLDTVAAVYRTTGTLVEKYDLHTIQPGDGGEYAVQAGFGWTNGVTHALLGAYSQHPAAAATAPA